MHQVSFLAILAMDGIKKKLTNLKLQIDEANDRASDLEKDKKELEERVQEVKLCS